MPRSIATLEDILPLLGEAFRHHGYEGASLALLCERTGLGKGSLYHFFPGGKEEMAAAVLEDIGAWFEREMFAPLRQRPPLEAVDHMCRTVEQYFHSGARICLVGAFALDDTRDQFAHQVRDYFTRWTDALTQVLQRGGLSPAQARGGAEEAVLRIQGALVLARARDEPACFVRAIRRLRRDFREQLASA